MEKNKRVSSVENVVAWRMCIGCGACKAVCPQGRIILHDVTTDGIRPKTDSAVDCANCHACLSVCPGIEMTNDTSDPEEIRELKPGWGTVLELYEGYAEDPDFRFNGSSGGVASALSLFCLEKLGIKRVVHTTADEKVPWRNRTTVSTDRKHLLAAAGSRYSPASPAEGIESILGGNGTSVFVGKPCDIAAHYKAAKMNPAIAEKTGCTIGIFCAGTPSTQGTIDLLKKLSVEKETISEFRYRGRGWPGMCSVRYQNDEKFTDKMTYMQSWGFIQKYRPVRCYQCPDGTSEFADIACGDPWHQKASPGETGISLIIARTRRGRTIIEQARDAGYITIKKTAATSLYLAQKNLLEKRGWIWGRLATLKILGIPAPSFNNYSLFRLWMRAPLMDKVRSIYGTLRRAVQRNYWKPFLPADTNNRCVDKKIKQSLD